MFAVCATACHLENSFSISNSCNVNETL